MKRASRVGKSHLGPHAVGSQSCFSAARLHSPSLPPALAFPSFLMSHAQHRTASAAQSCYAAH
eukprot:2195117-Rhodomonas_salina.2